MRILKRSFLAFVAVAVTNNPASAQTWVKNKIGTGADAMGSIIPAQQLAGLRLAIRVHPHFQLDELGSNMDTGCGRDTGPSEFGGRLR